MCCPIVGPAWLGADGVREAQEEFDRLQLHMRYQASQVPDKARDLADKIDGEDD